MLDGVSPSWADIEVRVAIPNGGLLLEMGDIISISSGVTVEVGRQKEGGRTIKRTAGDSTEECSLTLYLSGYQKLLRGLKAQAPLRGNQRRLSLVSFNILQLWTPFGSSEIFERRIKGCRILGNASDNTEGTDAARIEVPLDPVQIVDVIDGEECVLL